MKTKTMLKFFAALLFMLTISAQFNSAKAQAQSTDNPIEGMFYKNIQTNAYYWYAQSKFHYIETPNTLNGLFVRVSSSTFEFSGYPVKFPSGVNITPNTGIIRDTNTGYIYFLRDGYIHHLTTPAIMEEYHFNTSIVRNVSGIAGLKVCTSFPEGSQGPVQTPCSM